ncbi:aminotransferase class V-fold PLP-dependent enzyme [Helicobacter sp. 11S02629-2]|uniref:pyridoxal-phosphate-dependent aminotransferase family protein n=1 Tax=Helicobacter sp. 11S02629-2 TaxID=1476195 RepID=UPI000BA6197C|nr:aminotransferase class V-fold PLP-dependent enzyme [Helicobacter sp. 11S02629-2]PAF43692.1 aminotransferase [Helicobacter sp. 11S02629-2]
MAFLDFSSTLLFTPGPTPTPESLRLAMAQPTMHHRTKEFEAIFGSVKASLKAMCGMETVVMLTSSGTGAMQAALNTFSKKGLLTINSGKFGERFSLIAKAFNIPHIEITNEWDTPASLSSIKEALDMYPDIDSISFQICESSGGLEHPYKEIAAFVKNINKNIFVIADAITALGVEKIDTTNIDVLIGGSQKAFMLPPGLALLGLSKKAKNFALTNSRGYYFNLAKEIKSQDDNTTAFTAATSLIVGLKAYFDTYGESLESVYHHTLKISKATKKALQAIDLELYPKVSANCMSVFKSDDANEIIKLLAKKYKIILANGQDRLKGKICRINHMGYVPVNEASFVLNALELALQDLGIRKFEGKANKVFLENYYSLDMD